MNASEMSAARVGERAPDFTLPTVDGPPLGLSDLLGRKVVMFVWASW